MKTAYERLVRTVSILRAVRVGVMVVWALLGNLLPFIQNDELRRAVLSAMLLGGLAFVGIHLAIAVVRRIPRLWNPDQEPIPDR